MGIHPVDMRDQVIVPASRALGAKCLSASAVNLMLGCGAQESGFGEFGLVQRGGGPALGPWQMEPSTYYDTWDRAPEAMRAIVRRDVSDFDMLGAGIPNPGLMITDLRFAAMIARLKFWLVPTALPAADDRDGLWDYYKIHWNSTAGAATREQWDRNWIRYAMAVALKPGADL